MTRPPLFPTAPNAAVLGTGVVAYTRPAAPTILPDLSFDYLADGLGAIGDIRVNVVIIEVPPGPPPLVTNVNRYFEPDTEDTMTLVVVITTDLNARASVDWWMGPDQEHAIQSGTVLSSGFSTTTTIRIPGLQAATYPDDQWFLDTHIIVENIEGTDADAGWTGLASMVFRPWDISAVVSGTTIKTITTTLTTTQAETHGARVDYGIVSGIWSGSANATIDQPAFTHDVVAANLLMDMVYYLRASALSSATGLRGYAQEGILSARTNTPLSITDITPFAMGAALEVEMETAGVASVDWGIDDTYSGGTMTFSGNIGTNIVQLRGQEPATEYHVRVRQTGMRAEDPQAIGTDSVFTTLAANFMDWTSTVVPPNMRGDGIGPDQMDQFGIVRCDTTRFDPAGENVGLLFVRVTGWPIVQQQGAGTYRFTPCWRRATESPYTGHGNDLLTLEHQPNNVTRAVMWPDIPSEFPTDPGSNSVAAIDFPWVEPIPPQGNSPDQPYLVFRMAQNWLTDYDMPLGLVLEIKGVWIEKIA
jgi:hypothetical protein